MARLMRKHGIVSKHKRKFNVTKNMVHSYPIAENLLQRRFDVFTPDKCWVSNITYIQVEIGSQVNNVNFLTLANKNLE